jgi:hypothetical protein
MARSQGQRASQRQEKRLARSLGGRVTPASGATGAASAKGDVRVQGQVRAECKTTLARSYSLKLDEWRKIQHEAAVSGEMPVMQIEFQGTGGMNKKLAVIDWFSFEQLLACRKADAENAMLESFR